jgi:hypothetical protein
MPLRCFSSDVYILSIFSQDALYRFDSELLAETALNISERRFLETVGLPKEEILGWTFDPVAYGVRPVSRIASDRGAVGFDNADQIAIAGGQDTLACVDSHAHRFVISIDLMNEDRRRFINSSLVSFVACLAAYTDCCRKCALRQGDNQAKIAAFVKTIESIDDKCLDDSENWWSLIVEQIETGLL